MLLSLTTCLMQLLTRPKSSKTFLLKKFTRNSYPGILCAVVILLLTGLPGSSFPHIVKPVFGLDRVAHFLMFTGFAYITLWGYRKPYAEKGKAYRRKALWITLAVGVALGVLTEAIQSIPALHRDCDVVDGIADFLGCSTGIVIFYFFHPKKK